ncbi:MULTISPECIES: HBL/NHE enterotoxin family protein [Bacillus cereus group]|uniref:Enterotoxin n=1 Tax=Bacillus thuringiensis TaxID=1428 RepID=A0A9X7FSL2_BACTU|nr:HBL/NHE enterotoxin family protein [Bacillus thuringiensis]MCQ6337653.1 HBL/NHE enterotoxin family protein [Bacillus cereus]PFT34414.1 enterotoxin [Bacillus thuringiensis]
MKKIPVKLMTCAALVTTLSTASIMPSYVFASETKEVTMKNENQPNLPDKYLGPEGLQKALQETGSHVIVLDAYALTLLKSPQINLDKNIFTEEKDKDLVDAVINTQKVAQGNATHWIDVLKPELINVNQGIVNYGAKFDNYYQTIVDAVDAKDKETTKQGVQRLYKNVEQNKDKIDQLILDLKNFRDKLITDTNGFQTKTNQMLTILEGKNAIMPSLKQQIDAYNSQVSAAIAMIASGGVLTLMGTGFGVLTVVLAVSGVGLPFAAITGTVAAGSIGGGVTLIVTGNNKLKEANSQIAKLTMQLKDTDLQVAALKVASDQTKTFADTINTAIDSAETLKDQWTTMGSKYKSLMDNIDEISPSSLAFVKEDLKTAKDSWLNIKSYADTLYSKITINK